MIHISRSAVAARKLCPMKRYWAYHATHPDLPAEGQVGGLTPLVDPSGRAKSRGTLFHALMERAVLGQDLDQLPPELTGGMEEEQVVLCRRAAKGWLHQRGTLLLTEYAVQSTEAEWAWSLDPYITQHLRLDVILRHRETGELLILDYKTLARPDSNWIDRLRHSDQTHLYLQALTERTEEPVAMQYEGILIGSYEDGVQKSPFVLAYEKHGHLSPRWSAGSTKVSLLSWTDDQWLAWALEHQLLPTLYCTTGPLAPPVAQLLATKAATIQAELLWADTIAQLDAAPEEETRRARRERLIERYPDSCLKFGKGYACPYGTLCWGGAQPDAETFTPRIDHHQPKEPTA